MCEGYWDKRTQRWVSLEEIEERDLEGIMTAELKLPAPIPEARRRPALLAR